MPRLNPAVMPSGVTAIAGGSLNPSAGSNSRSVLTNCSGPMKVRPTPSAVTSGLRPGSAVNRSVPMDSVTTSAKVKAKPRSSPRTAVSGAEPSSRLTVRTSSTSCAPVRSNGPTLARSSGFQTSRVTVAVGRPASSRSGRVRITGMGTRAPGSANRPSSAASDRAPAMSAATGGTVSSASRELSSTVPNSFIPASSVPSVPAFTGPAIAAGIAPCVADSASSTIAGAATPPPPSAPMPRVVFG